jgi:hypothetical protein
VAVINPPEENQPHAGGKALGNRVEVFGPSIRPWSPGDRVSGSDRPARPLPLGSTGQRLALRIAENERTLRDGAMERREIWKAHREALAELRAEQSADRAVRFSRYAETRRRAQEVRRAAEDARATSREERARSLSAHLSAFTHR